MPLPDERPRQSVANLIGRFENQTKRQAPTPGVTSHHTGEPLNHELKEKREWPPRTIGERVASLDASARPRPSIPPSQSAPEPMVPQAVSEAKPMSSDVPSETDGNPVAEREIKDEQQPDAIEVAQATKSSLPTTPPRAQTVTKPQSAKASQIPTTSKPAARTIIKPAPKQSPGAPTIQPLKPQHTGLSTISTTSTKKPATKPLTSASAKTPVRSVSVMAASPASTRPKTPSSGLFAPTAASLAKSRSAQSPPMSTTPIKKPALIANASERLSKPTAASLSKARSPVPSVPPLPRATVKSTVGAHSPAKPVAKSKTTTQASSRKTSAASASAVDVPVANVEKHLETNDQHEILNGHTPEKHSQEPHPFEEAAVSLEGPESSENADGTLDEVDPESDSRTNNTTASSNGNGLQARPPEGQYSSDGTIDEHQICEEKQHQEHQGDDIENIVNLLEAVPIPKVRPASIASIPDEVHEIPDEE